MKKLSTLLFFLSFCFAVNAQINSIPGGPFNWTNSAAWVGGVPPTSGQVANIVNGSTINLDVPVIRNADLHILGGGVLTSSNPTNSLTINNANLSNSGHIDFNVINPVPITINNGNYTSSISVCNCGNFYLNMALLGNPSTNFGNFNVFGNLTIVDADAFNVVYFLNGLSVNVTGTFSVGPNCIIPNDQACSTGTLINQGYFDNSGTLSVTDSVQNQPGAFINGAGQHINIGGKLNNASDIVMNDTINIGTNLNNTGSINNSGVMNIQNNFYNNGTITGSANGKYNIGLNSTNSIAGVISGNIDVCDATLLPTTYLDVDNGTVDLATVTFCTISFSGVDPVDPNAGFNIYPNPSNGIYNLTHFENSTITILNAEGKVVLNQQIQTANVQVDLTTIPAGIYFVQVENEGRLHYNKLIKQ